MNSHSSLGRPSSTASSIAMCLASREAEQCPGIGTRARSWLVAFPRVGSGILSCTNASAQEGTDHSTAVYADIKSRSMPRPKLHSDEFILDAALSVLLQKGPSTFTLSDVAETVGMSRAALIQRFKDKATLHHRVMERSTQQVRNYFENMHPESDLDELWAMLKDLIGGMGSGSGTEGYLLLLWGDVQEPSLRSLSAERNRLVLKAIEDGLPFDPHPRDHTAGLVQAIIQGACMQWLVSPEGELAGFMIDRTRRFLSILYPDHQFT